MTSLFADEPQTEAVVPSLEMSPEEAEVATQIEVRLDLDLAIDIEVGEPPPPPPDPDRATTFNHAAAAAGCDAAARRHAAAERDDDVARRSELAGANANRAATLSRVLVAAAVALGILGAAVAEALRLHLG